MTRCTHTAGCNIIPDCRGGWERLDRGNGKKKNPDNFVRRVGRVHGPQPFIGRFITLRNIILGEFDNIRRRRDFSSIVFLLALFPRRLRYCWCSCFELNTTTPPRARTVNGFAKTNKICYIIQQPPPPKPSKWLYTKKI